MPNTTIIELRAGEGGADAQDLMNNLGVAYLKYLSRVG